MALDTEVSGEGEKKNHVTATPVEVDMGDSEAEDSMMDTPRSECGVPFCRPAPLQSCASIVPFTANVSGLFFINVAFFAYYLGTIRTLEKRFELSSIRSSITLSVMDVMFSVLSLIIGYFGRRAHKPRVMAFCQVVTSLGIFVLVLPFAIYGPKQQSSPVPSWPTHLWREMPSQEAMNKMMGLCVSHDLRGNSTASSAAGVDETCGDDVSDTITSEESRKAYALLLSGSLLIGLGGVAVSNLGIPYIDENAKAGESACFVGVATSAYSWAPIVGLLLAALCTRVPETLTDQTGLKPSHPSYIGAWWLGMIILGCVSLAIALPMVLFPKHLKEYYNTTNTRDKKDLSEQRKQRGCDNQFKEFPKLMCKFLTNPPYVTLLLSKICGLYGVTGIILQLPRYMEIHYRQPAYIASIIAALSGGIVGALGTVLGGLVLCRLKLDTRGIARMFTVATTFGVIGTALCMTYGCPETDLDGRWDEQTNRFHVDSQCSASCGCQTNTFLPVCSDDSKLFLSPCHAGCRNVFPRNNTFSDCHCVEPEVDVTQGYCSSDTCRTIVPYVITFVTVSFLVAFGRVPATILMFRLVGSQEKAPVMGLTSFFVNILCFVPAPIFFGLLFDRACLIWKTSCSGATGACLLYDRRQFRLLMHGVTLAFQVPSLLFAAITLYLVRHMHGPRTDEPPQQEALSLTVATSLLQNDRRPSDTPEQP